MKKTVLVIFVFVAAFFIHAVFGGVEYITYNADIKSILDDHCKQCHNFAETYTALLAQVSTDTATKGVPIVDPGKPENSVIVWRIEGETNVGTIVTQMPRNNPPLPDETIRLIRDWIEQGAYEDEPVAVEDGTTTWSKIKMIFQ